MSLEELSPATQRLLSDRRERVRSRLVARELLVQGLFALAFVGAASLLALLAPAPERVASLPLAGAFVVAFALLATTQLPTGAGHDTPTQVIFVPMLLLLPPAAVPLLVALALALATTIDAVRGRVKPERALIGVADAWFSLGPALLLVLAGASGPDWGDWPLYVAALASQFAVDGAVFLARARAVFGERMTGLVAELPAGWRLDAVLSLIGLLAAFAGAAAPATALLVVALAGLLRLFAREREGHVESMLELGRAYRGTALLLDDVIGGDDAYTGEHTQGVVALAVRVADELGVDAETRRQVELGAMLHDVGKIAIPKAIVNKPGPLDDDEWAIMKTHTIEGQRMLERVGGLLGRVGVVVRASHERWDGGGYPDGLAGEAIPRAAAIVAACDAWDAMRTDRPYRGALPFAVALAELEANAGTQFDPAVAAALVAVVSRD